MCSAFNVIRKEYYFWAVVFATPSTLSIHRERHYKGMLKHLINPLSAVLFHGGRKINLELIAMLRFYNFYFTLNETGSFL